MLSYHEYKINQQGIMKKISLYKFNIELYKTIHKQMPSLPNSSAENIHLHIQFSLACLTRYCRKLKPAKSPYGYLIPWF